MVICVKMKPRQLYNQTSCSASLKAIIASLLVKTQNDHLDQEKGEEKKKRLKIGLNERSSSGLSACGRFRTETTAGINTPPTTSGKEARKSHNQNTKTPISNAKLLKKCLEDL